MDDFRPIEVAKDERYVALRGKGQVQLEGFELSVSLWGARILKERQDLTLEEIFYLAPVIRTRRL